MTLVRPRWFASDLDGTLLSPQARLTPRAIGLLRQVLDRGVLFTVASARSLDTMRALLAGVPLELPVVAHNGAIVGDPFTGRVDHLVPLPAPLAEEVLHLGLAADQAPLFTTHDGQQERLSHLAPVNDGQRAYLRGQQAVGDPRLRQVSDLRPVLRDPVLSATFIGERHALTDLHRTLVRMEGLHAHLFDDLYAPGWVWVTVHPAQASKATGLGWIVERHQLSEHDLVVFGDQVNDLSMFEAADVAFAMAGAPPAVQAAADHILGSHADDAVARWLEEHTR